MHNLCALSFKLPNFVSCYIQLNKCRDDDIRLNKTFAETNVYNTATSYLAYIQTVTVGLLLLSLTTIECQLTVNEMWHAQPRMWAEKPE